MAGVVGRLLPLAVVVAISPLPIITVVLMLLAPKAGGAGAGFLLGWISGIGGVTTVVVLLAEDIRADTDRLAFIAAAAELGLGILMLVLALWQRWAPSREGERTLLPAWLGVVDRLTVTRASGLGLLLSAANPKALLVCVAAGLAIAGGALPAAQNAAAVMVFTSVAVSTVGVLVLAYTLGGPRIARPLRSVRDWLTVHSAAATASLLCVIGVVLMAQGASGLI